MIFFQVCLAGGLLVAIIVDNSNKKDVVPAQKVFVVAVERERKVGGGYKYR